MYKILYIYTKNFRRYLVKQYIILHGPGFKRENYAIILKIFVHSIIF